MNQALLNGAGETDGVPRMIADYKLNGHTHQHSNGYTNEMHSHASPARDADSIDEHQGFPGRGHHHTNGVMNGSVNGSAEANGCTTDEGQHSFGTPYFTFSPIAVVGIACRLPGHCNSPHALWQFMCKGGIAGNKPPESQARFHLDGHYDGSQRPATMPTPGGMFLEHVDLTAFDAPFFNIGTTDALSLEPQQRQLLELIYELLETSGVTMEGIRGTNVGCIVGASSCDYEAMSIRDPDDTMPGSSTGHHRSILSNRISHFLDIKGPSVAVDTACSSTLVALDMACAYLQRNQADGMLVAGASLFLDPGAILDRGAMGGAFSTSGRCHAFDAKADGYVKAEAINAVYLKRFDDALRDGDPIRAVIRGTAVNADGKTPTLTQPSSEAHAAAIRAAYKSAGISNLNDTGYLECHGTGTLTGDPLEIAGIASVFAATRTADKPLLIGSIKSNIGHSEPAAGLSGLLKAVMAVERGLIPGNPTFITPNPRIPFDASRVKASRTNVRWPKSTIRRASVNSYGFGGANAHAIVESVDSYMRDYQRRFISSYDVRAYSSLADVTDDGVHLEFDKASQLLVFSANDKDSLKQNIEAISNHLLNPSVNLKLSDIAYTMSERRSHHFHRAFIVTDTPEYLPGSEITGKKRAQAPRVGYIFTGQGAQWSQMGRQLLKTFSTARATVLALDKALQTLPDPPKWSLMSELSEKRDSVALRNPEFSQPLTTALQLAMLSVFEDWNIRPDAVVGHSSGEIAAAVSAGFLSPEEAIKVAYLRGLSAKKCPPEVPLTMLAVGLSEEDVAQYLGASVEIACYNSPKSLTLSGPYDTLERVRDEIQKDGHFARLLQVDLAYHSKYMDAIGDRYAKMLHEHCPESIRYGNGVTMYSSVTTQAMGHKQAIGPQYWQMNMVNPVRFSQAASLMLSGSEGVDFLIEVGPSNALAGPVLQITRAMFGDKPQVEYAPAAKRGPEPVLSMLHVAGKLWASGGDVSISKVNGYHNPSFIVDLPNYRWNRSYKYWFEPLPSMEWRHRKFITHDLLGTKTLSSTWGYPSWMKNLHLSDVSWLRGHEVGDRYIFPAAGYLTMVVEAAYQAAVVNLWSDEKKVEGFRYRFKDVKFLKALNIPETERTKLMTVFSPVYAALQQWYEFTVQNYSNDAWSTCCTGLIRVEDGSLPPLQQLDLLKPLRHPVSGLTSYDKMARNGFKYGPDFQRLKSYEWTWGATETRAIISLKSPESQYKQSSYPIHPVSLDSFFQLCGFPGSQIEDTWTEKSLPLPGGIDSLVVSARRDRDGDYIGHTAAKYIGSGSPQSANNYKMDGGIYDPVDGSPVLEIKGMKFDALEIAADRTLKHVYANTAWDAHVSLNSQEALAKLLQQPPSLGGPNHGSVESIKDVKIQDGEHESKDTSDNPRDTLQRILDLISHQKPILDVLEVNTEPDNQNCLWLKRGAATRKAFSTYLYTSSNSETVQSCKDSNLDMRNATFEVLDLTDGQNPLPGPKYDLAILNATNLSEDKVKTLLLNVKQAINEEGQLILQTTDQLLTHEVTEKSLTSIGFPRIKRFSTQSNASLVLAEAQTSIPSSHEISCVTFLDNGSQQSQDLRSALEQLGWQIQLHQGSTEAIVPKSTIVVLDEIYEVVSSQFNAQQWSMLQDLIQKECNLLWVTSGAQLDVKNPMLATTHGLLRVISNEEPHLHLVTLDIEDPSASTSADALDVCMKLLTEPGPRFKDETELVERQCIIYVPRVVADEPLNEAKAEDVRGRTPRDVDLRTPKTCIRLQAERIGAMDSIQWTEVSPEPLALEDDWIEVDIKAAGVNFKDIATILGIVLGDGKLLGGDAAGVISGMGPGVQGFKLGDRVLAMIPGSFANKLYLQYQFAYRIPDYMSFEEAATLPVVYLTAVYGILDLAKLKKNQRVLIHSATGGLGNAVIQICKYVGAEIYATVGNDEKSDFLQHTFGIPKERIFSSRTTAFEEVIMKQTNGRGIDVIVNSLSGELLEASWNLVAYGGTMIELGRKDISVHNRLSLEPFGRSASFCAYDLIHLWSNKDSEKLQSLFNKLFELLNAGHIKPIFPLQTFGFDNVLEAFRTLRTGKHIGKLVVSHTANQKETVPVRPAPRTVKLRNDACYLLIGGLRGLCGSLAIELARQGAKYVAVVSRSGHDDDTSQHIAHGVRSLGAHIDLLCGDVSILEDVERVFSSTAAPVGGIVMGAMVLLDRPFHSMAVEEYHKVLPCKIQGTWNLHNVALSHSLNLDFFTMLSSISSIVGTGAQANYVAANAFQDAFSSYRRGLGLPACTVNLGIVEDVGYMNRNSDVLARFDESELAVFLNENMVCKILDYSIMNQSADPISSEAFRGSIITGLRVPIPPDSEPARYARFSALLARQDGRGGAEGEAGSGASAGNKDALSADVRKLKSLLQSKIEPAVAVEKTLEVVINYLAKTLRVEGQIEPERPLTAYGMDSLAVVEFRSWLRRELGAGLSTLDVTTASSLVALCKIILEKMEGA